MQNNAIELWNTRTRHGQSIMHLLKTLASRDDINVIVEVGTNSGMSAIAFAEGLKVKSEKLPKGATVHTFDIVPWDHSAFQNKTWLQKSIFKKTGD